MRCFVINLDRSSDRLAAMREQLARLGMDWQRVPAVDGSVLCLPDDRLVDEEAFKRRHHALLRRGEIGAISRTRPPSASSSNPMPRRA